MGGVVGTLSYMYCQSGCQASIVASYLAFHPPNSTYDIIEYDVTEESDIEEFEKTIDSEPLDKDDTTSNNLNSNNNIDKYKVLTENNKNATYAFIFRENVNPQHEIGYPIVRNPSSHIITTVSNTQIPILYFQFPTATRTLLFSHGNATDLGGMFNVLYVICLQLKVNVVGYDYTGYGWSKHENVHATEKQTYKDILSVYNWLISTKKILNPKTDLIIYGQSVGSGPSTYLAVKHECAGLVLHSPILSGIRVLTDSRFLWCFDIFPNIDRIKTIKCPVFIIHGEDDQEVRINHGRGLYEATPEAYRFEPWWVPHRGHNNVLSGNEKEFFKRMNDFLKSMDTQNLPVSQVEIINDDKNKF